MCIDLSSTVMAKLTLRQVRRVKKLLIFATICLLGNYAIYRLTAELANKNEQQRYLATLQLDTVLPPNSYDNNILATKHQDGNRIIYQACQQQQPRYALVEIMTDKGYGGDITILVSVDLHQHEIVHARILSHRESPGLGDQIEAKKTYWLEQFYLSLTTQANRVAIRQDKGRIDAIPAATMSSRAVSDAIRQQVFTLDFAHMPNRCTTP